MMHAGPKAHWLWLWGFGYALMLGAVIWGLISARQWALSELATPQSVREWQAWREDVRRQQNRSAPVQRRVPKSDEPPALVLMRDYLVVSFVGSVLFSSLLYWIIAWFVTGIVSGQTAKQPDS